MDIELSRDEDSVTSLAVAESSQDSAIVLAGINSSAADQQAGRNEHLRSFQIGYPPRKKDNESTTAAVSEEKPAARSGKTTALGQVSLFKPSSAVKQETYQRLLRLSPARHDTARRLGAAATGLAPVGEIVVFDATKSVPQPADIYSHVELAKGEEAADVDIIQREDGDYQFAYCTDLEIYDYVVTPSRSHDKSSKPRFLHGTPFPDVFASSNVRPKFRAIRFLTPKHLLLLQNQPSGAGAQLLIVEIGESGLSSVVFQKRLHKSMKAAVGLDVAILPADSKGEMQVAVAVAGQDISIELLTIDYSASKGLGKFRLHSILRNVHPLQMTKIAFSTFRPTAKPAGTDTTKPGYLKLASVSMGNTVVVHTIPVTPYPIKSKQPRYVLTPPGASETAQMTFSVLVSIIVVALGAFFIQAFTEIRGGTPPYLGAKNWLSPSVRDWIARPYMFENVSAPVIATNIPAVEHVRDALPDIPAALGLKHLLHRTTSGDDVGKAIVVRSEGTEVSAEVHHDEEIIRREAKRWEDLDEHQQKAWKRKLIELGEWAVEEGETILKGIFFSEIAGAVGHAVGGG